MCTTRRVAVSHTAAVQLAAHYRQFLDNKFKHYLLVCSLCVKQI